MWSFRWDPPGRGKRNCTLVLRGPKIHTSLQTICLTNSALNDLPRLGSTVGSVSRIKPGPETPVSQIETRGSWVTPTVYEERTDSQPGRTRGRGRRIRRGLLRVIGESFTRTGARGGALTTLSRVCLSSKCILSFISAGGRSTSSAALCRRPRTDRCYPTDGWEVCVPPREEETKKFLGVRENQRCDLR